MRALLLRATLPLLLAASTLHAGTVERLGDLGELGGGPAGFPFDNFGVVLGTVGSGGGARVLACITGDRPALWAFGPTPESAQPLGGACPRDRTLMPIADREGVAALLYVAFPDEVWRTDGTPAGTFPLVPRSPAGQRPVSIAALGRQALLFLGQEVVVTDGTLAGTLSLATFAGSIVGVETLDGSAIFVASVVDAAGQGLLELWRSDGTPAGTRRLARIAGDSFVDPLVRSGSRVFVLLQDGLWVTDGSEAGTRQSVASWYSFGIYPHALQAVGYRGGIAFEAEPNDPGPAQIWWSDGTPRGTRRLASLPTGVVFTANRFRVLGSRLLFVVEDRLWTSDGTSRGTAPLAGCRGGCPRVYDLGGVELGGALLLRAGDERRGFELWRTNGTGPGTRMLRESCRGACGFLETEPAPWRGGVAYLAADGPFQQAALWYSDGTVRGTRRLAEVGEIINNGGPLAEAGGDLYQMLFLQPTGWQLWKLDGTAAGTLPVTRLLGYARPDPQQVESLARPDGGVWVWNGVLVSSDGTRGGTRQLTAAYAVDFLGTTANLGIVQRGSDHDSIELLALPPDGGAEVVLADLPSGHWARQATPFDGGLALVVSCCGFGAGRDELWVTDGTPSGTAVRFTFPNDEARLLAVDGDDLYFSTAGAGVGGGSILWKSDGTAAGTVELAHRPGMGNRLVRAGSELFFVAAGRSFGPELWRTDGTAAGTRPLFDDGGPRAPGDLIAFDGALYLAAADPQGGTGSRALWRFDPATRQLAALARFAAVGGPWTFVATAERLFFAAAETAIGGTSLYGTDGTAAGTVRVAALTPPGDAAYPPLPAPAALGEELLFTALDPLHGHEAWVSDGTAAGTHLVRDLVPGPPGSMPSGWVAAGDRAFFAAGDGVHGAGLFIYDPARPACSTSEERACLGGRWEAEVAFPALGEPTIDAAEAVATGTSSALFAPPGSGDPLVALRIASPGDGGASVAAAGLTRVWWIATVTDTATGEGRRYVSLPAVAVRFDDREAFPAPGTAKAAVTPRLFRAARPIVAATTASRRSLRSAAATEAPCESGATTACLVAGRFTVRGHRGEVPAAARAVGDRIALLEWPPDATAPSGTGGAAGDPDAAVRVAPLATGGFEVFFASLAPAPGAAVVRDGVRRSATYANPAGALTLIDDAATFASP